MSKPVSSPARPTTLERRIPVNKAEAMNVPQTSYMMMKAFDTNPLDGWYRIGPAAAEVLLNNGTKNRHLSEIRATFIASQIDRGAWEANGESIVIDADGRLCDGQHRMRAVVICGTPITVYVVHLPKHLGSGFFDTIDSGQNRTVANRFDIDGVSHYALAGAITRRILAWENGWRGTSHGRGKIALVDLRERYEADKENIQRAVTAVTRFALDLRGLAPQSIIGFVYFFASRTDPDKASEWLRGVATGENLETGNPALLLRNRLIAEKSSPTKRMAQTNVIVAAIRSWTAFYENRKLVKLLADVREDRDFPNFPEPVK